MSQTALSPFATHRGPASPGRFADPHVTADGSLRAKVGLRALETLWFNTGSLCNIACVNCYIESSPTNDALVYLTAADVEAFLTEIARDGLPTQEIGFTGGEPFMNPDMLGMLDQALASGRRVLVLTNAMRPMLRWGERLAEIVKAAGPQLTFRVSLDHHTQAIHDAERGAGAWDKAWAGLGWLSEQHARIAIAGRRTAHETEAEARAAFAELFRVRGLEVEAFNPGALVLFPEMEAGAEVPEITEACWGILNRSPNEMMCATSRMVVRRRGAAAPAVVACTLTPYDPQFELSPTLAEASGMVSLNHPFCAQFCVLGGASCSA
ncbi:MAG: radical SAM protein [Phenylobacterium sp.]|uniref:radical SAM protein n=1 Tax=Phenylobacterium sp. TaxID=1871053 RepID=UPI00271D76D2|nr:radical SAM protein [Phenylobacterium sp.]MDO8899777.1 radical SAM protein [Phenylobacterium sp.]MDP2213724.1 radical SAM protein [Phenylobacterium sp.]